MFKNYLAAVVFGLISCSVAAQVTVSRLVPAGLAPDRLVILLDSLFAGAAYQAVDTLSLQLMNFYPLDKDRYWVTVGCMDGTTMSKIFSFVARDSARARAFDSKNEIIAKKLGLTPENLHFYLTDNYQQIQTLLGHDYDAEAAGDVRDGYWKGDSIFATMHNEDYSHDLVHNYTLKIRTNTRNSAAEEGLAYYWGNAYYTDANGQMIDYPIMVSALRTYLQTHPDSTSLSLFRHNAKVFPALAPEVSARSVISALLFEYIEKTKGVEGIKALINCGKGDDNYFNTLSGLTGINRENFDEKVRGLLVHK